MKNYLLPVLIGLFVMVAVPLTVYLAANPNIVADLRNRASSPTGDITVSLDPAASTVAVNDTYSAAVKINAPTGTTITGAQFLLRYNYTDAVPEIEVTDSDTAASGIQVEPGTTAMDVASNLVTVDPTAKTVSIEFAAAKSGAGYTPTGEFTLAIIHFKANAPTSGVTVSFNQSLSKVFKSDGTDALLTPTTTGTYVVTGGGNPTPTPTATG